MGNAKNYPPCLQLIAAFSRYEAGLDWIWSSVASRFNAIGLLSPRFEFRESEYYHASMGSPLLKQFAILEAWYDPAELASHKLETNAMESEFANQFRCQEPRPLNVDPGYMSLTKIVLASTKNREHRVYLRDGIYAEVTLAFRNQHWQPMPWTYPDYQREDFRVFFLQARKYLTKAISQLGVHD
ncbi:MAG: DUF4416 family protein [Pirellula sp.]